MVLPIEISILFLESCYLDFNDFNDFLTSLVLQLQTMAMMLFFLMFNCS